MQMSTAPDRPNRLYLAGPMSGFAEHNFPLFNRVAGLLRDAGHTVFNPAENDDGGVRQSRSFYMQLDIPALLASEAVVLLPGWQRSRGASLEVWLALDLGMPIYRCDCAGEQLNLCLVDDLGDPRLPFEEPKPRLSIPRSPSHEAGSTLDMPRE